MAFPANGLRGMLSGLNVSDLGLGPGNDSSEPIWRFTQITPSLSNIQQIITAAYTYDMVLSVNFAGSRATWCNPGPPNADNPNGTLHYDVNKYHANVQQYANVANIQQAINDRKILNFTVDEPFITFFDGTISKAEQNEMGLFHKSIWSNCLTVMRSPGNMMTPPPAGGWTGVDYGTAQFNRAASNSGLGPRGWYAQQRDLLAAVGCGMIPAVNWLDGGDGRNWDFLNNGKSSGTVWGPSGSPKFLMSPAEIQAVADGIFDDPLAPGLQGFTHVDNNFLPAFLQYQNRSDFIAAFDYSLNKLASRPHFNPWPTPKGTTGGGGGGGGAGGEIDHAFSDPIIVRVSTTANAYTAIPGAVLLANDMKVGKNYLVVVSGAFDLGGTTAEGYVRLLNGSTVVPRSESAFTVNQTNAHFQYSYVGVTTAVAGQDLTLQYRNNDNVTAIGADLVQIFVMNITDDLTPNVDVKWAESSAVTTLTTAYQDGAKITFTPQNAGDNWLILSSAHFQTPSATASVVSGLRRSGEDVGTDPEVQMEGEDTANDLYRLTVAKVLPLGANSNTFAEQSKNTGSGGPRDGSFVFALRLNAFSAHAFAYDNTDLALSTTSFASLLGTATATSVVDGDVWALGSFGWAPNSLISGLARLKINGNDAPFGQSNTQARYSLAFDATDVVPTFFSSCIATTTGSQNTTLEASAISGASSVARGRLSMIVTMALAGSAAGTKFRNNRSSIGTRAGTRKVL